MPQNYEQQESSYPRTRRSAVSSYDDEFDAPAQPRPRRIRIVDEDVASGPEDAFAFGDEFVDVPAQPRTRRNVRERAMPTRLSEEQPSQPRKRATKAKPEQIPLPLKAPKVKQEPVVKQRQVLGVLL